MLELSPGYADVCEIISVQVNIFQYRCIFEESTVSFRPHVHLSEPLLDPFRLINLVFPPFYWVLKKEKEIEKKEIEGD